MHVDSKMERVREGSKRNKYWPCTCCNAFQALTLRVLLGHYRIVHANEPNFRVVCNVDGCPSTFYRWNSYYKHVLRHHQQFYDEKIKDNQVERNQESVENPTQAKESSHGDLDLGDGRSLDGNVSFEDDSDNDSASGDEYMLHLDQRQGSKVDIQKSAASFLLKVKERNKIPQAAMESIIDSTRTLIKQVVSSVKSDVLTVLELDEQKDTVENIFESAPDPFIGIETDALQSKYIRENFVYVQYKQVLLGKKLTRKKKGPKRVVCEKEETFIYIPLLESLRQLLLNERIAAMVLKKPNCSNPDVFYDIQDGHVYKSDSYFDEHDNALSLLIYHDELEVCNPLGSNAGTHKVDMYYYTVGNISPRFRSRRCAVRLLAIANADLVKKYGIHSIMQPIIEDLQLLYNGYMMELNGVEKIIYGKVMMCTGDTLGQHYWGGFKEGVGAAFQKCRHCQCAFNQMQTDFKEELFSERTKESYNKQCNEIEKAPAENVRKDLQTTYGINRRSPLCKIPTFDVIKQLPQDIMHTLLEGTVQYEVRLVLQHYIQSGVTTLSQINGAIASHEYGYSEVSDKPGPLKESVFFGDERYKLKYKAAQARLFLRLLPFMIGPLVDTEDSYYTFLIELIQIVQLIFSPVIKTNSIQYLKQLIADHLSKFKELFPNANVLPKQHYLIHIPSTITMLGPMVRSSCFSFESAHSYFKDLARKQNFKNLPLSLAKRHQFNECCNFGDPEENPSSHPLFSNEKTYGVTKKAHPERCHSLQERFDSLGLLPGITLGNDVPVYKASWIILNGTKYTKTSVIAVDAEGDPIIPVFGIILAIWLIKDYVYFEVDLLNTLCFDYYHQAYEVTAANNTGESMIFSNEGLVDYNVFHVKKDQHGNTYVPVKYDLDDILEEHVEGRNPFSIGT